MLMSLLLSNHHRHVRPRRQTLAVASHGQNRTKVTEFLLLAFGNLHYFNGTLFALFLLLYILALTGNVLVIFLVAVNPSLHSPMYFFLSQMSLSEILFTSNIVPNMLHLVLVGGGNVSITRCLLQFCVSGVAAIAQCFVLAVMSFDRYVAICIPLHYSKIMTFKMQVQSVLVCWSLGLIVSLLVYIVLYKLEFCESNTIDHYYCDIAPVLKLTCSDTQVVELLVSLLSTPLVVSPFLVIIVTYIAILLTILKIPTLNGKQKAFSTCSSHLSIVCMYYGTFATIYILKPGENSQNVNKGLSLLYTLVTPLLNPVVYSLRNKDIRRAVEKTTSTWRKQMDF